MGERGPHYKVKVTESTPVLGSAFGREGKGAITNKLHHDKERERVKSMKIKRYVIKDLLETGSTGNVFCGVDKKSKRKVALKVISRSKYIGKENKEIRENRILREALLSFLLDHPNIARLKDFFFTEDNFYLIFEYVSGVQLLKHIVQHGVLDEEEARRYFRDVVQAVDYCHSHSVVHRDLKIENIMIDGRGRAVLIDFGLSNFYDGVNLLSTFCGSLHFAAPELLSGRPYTGPEIDIWSLGVILYVMVCGKIPFDEKNTQSLYNKILTVSLSMPPSLSPALSLLIRGMLTADPKGRITLPQILGSEWVGLGGGAGEEKVLASPPSSFFATAQKLFGDQFKHMSPSLLLSLSALLNNRAASASAEASARVSVEDVDRPTLVMKFIEGEQKVKVTKTLFKYLKRGIKTNNEQQLARKIENTLNSKGITTDIKNGKFFCLLKDTPLLFTLHLVKNVLTSRYGVSLKSLAKDKAGDGGAFKKTKTLLYQEIFKNGQSG